MGNNIGNKTRRGKKKIKNLFVDLKFPILYFILPIIIGILLLNYAFNDNLYYMFEKYGYTGSETLSIFGLLEFAHYRYDAIEQLCGWQFFFGNMQFFIIFALVMAGFFHLIKPKMYSKSDSTPKLERSDNYWEEKDLDTKYSAIKKIGKTGIIGMVIIIIVEILFSSIGNPETGLGDHTYVNSYYQNIGELIFNGYYTINNQPYFAQMFMSLLPIFLGFGIFFYSHGIKALKERGLLNSDAKLKPVGVILFSIALLYFNILALTNDIPLESAVTSFTAYMMVYWLLNGFLLTSIVLVIIRFIIPISNRKDGNYRFKLKPIMFFFMFLILIVSFAASFLVPYLDMFGLETKIEIPGIKLIQIVLGLILLGTIILVIKKEKVQGFELVRGISLILGFCGLLLVLIIWAINPNAGNIEISWMYAGIIPSIFLVSLTLTFYYLGFTIKPMVAKIRNILKESTEKAGNIQANLEKNIKSIIETSLKNPGIKTAAIFLIFINAAMVPSIMGMKMFGEDPEILINNVGMFTDQDQTFLLATKYDHPNAEGTYQVIDKDTRNVVRTGTLEYKGLLWNRYHWLGNFTGLTTDGNYYIKAELGALKAESYDFIIGDNYLDDALKTNLYWYYYTRCGTELTVLPEHTDKYPGHDTCHTTDAWYLYNDTNAGYVYINSSHTNMGLNLAGEWVETTESNLGLTLTGGWHDSGDYNVYGTRVAPCSYALVYAFDQLPGFYNEDPQRTAYPQNNSIPDIIEESMFGLEYWMRRWYEPEQMYFDSNMLGANGSKRWTVFGEPEYEDQFADGRWIVDDEGECVKDGSPVNNTELYLSQFLRGSSVQLVTASFAAMARICEDYGYYQENITALKEWANKSRYAYDYLLGYSHSNVENNDDLIWRGYSYQDLVCEEEMYKLTGNITYLENAINISNYLLERTESKESFIDFNTLGFLLGFVQEYNGSINDWDGLSYIEGNNTIENLYYILETRTEDETNYFNFLRSGVEDKPVYPNDKFMVAIFSASYAWNMTENATIKAGLYDFITNHFDWLFGRNMENICQMEGLSNGENTVYQYTTRYRYIPGLLKGGYPGFIIDGFEYFPGDYGEDNVAGKTIIPKITNTYREVWSVMAESFTFCTSTFYAQILGRT